VEIFFFGNGFYYFDLLVCNINVATYGYWLRLKFDTGDLNVTEYHSQRYESYGRLFSITYVRPSTEEEKTQGIEIQQEDWGPTGCCRKILKKGGIIQKLLH
jgi:hypothetical protein